MEFLFIVISAALPAVAMLAWVASRDRLPEPPKVVVLTALFGGLVTVPIVLVELGLVGWLGLPQLPEVETIGQALLWGFVVAALTEEVFKLLVIRGYSARHDAFDEPFDGIVYGVAASLGFAIAENVLYVGGGALLGGIEAGIGIALARALTAVPMHAVCGVIMGACIGAGRYEPNKGWLLWGLLSAIGIHGTYDAFLFSAAACESLQQIALCILGCISTLICGAAAAGLTLARMRRDQMRSIALSTVESADWQDEEGVAGHESSYKDRPRVPVLPVLSLATAGLSVLVVVCSVWAAMIMAQYGGLDVFGDADLEFLGSCLILALVLVGISTPLSVVSIIRESKWRPASVLALLCSGAQLVIIAWLFVLALTDGT